MRYLQLITICLFIISCSSVPDTDDMTPSKDVLTEENNLMDTLTQLTDISDLEVVEPIEGKTIQHQGYDLIFGESTQSEFENLAQSNTSTLMTETECVNNNRITIKSPKEIDLKLSNDTYFTLRKEKDDEQFFGYIFKHYDADLNIYVLWENWLEAGHPIMVNGTTGKITTIFGETFATNKNQTLTANVAADIGSGWTPNGLQVFEIVDDSYAQLFDFDPAQILNESWGPVDLKWKNDNTIYLKCITHDGKGGSLNLYKVIQFNRKISK